MVLALVSANHVVQNQLISSNSMVFSFATMSVDGNGCYVAEKPAVG